MGCACGKRKTAPTGASANASKKTPAITSKTPAPSKSSGKTQTFTLQTRDGRTESFGSLLEARAARVRAGGGTVRPL